MDTPRHDIEIQQGATFQIGFVYRDPAGNPINLTNWKARMQVRERIAGKILADLSTENGRIVIDPLAGRVDCTIPASITRSMMPARGAFDIFLTSLDDFTIRLIEGEAVIKPSVTRS